MNIGEGENMSIKIKVNEPCSCGSGKLFKECCYTKMKLEMIEHGILGISRYGLIRNGKKVSAILDDILVKNIYEDSMSTNEFDIKYKDEIYKMSHYYSQFRIINTQQLIKSNKENDELLNVCSFILKNACETIKESIGLLREADCLQASILLRPVFEMLSTTVYLKEHQDKLDDFRQNNLESSKTIKFFKQIFSGMDELERLEDYFSKGFIHIEPNYSLDYYWVDYAQIDNVVGNIMLLLKKMMLLLFCVTEIIYYDEIKHYYITKVNDKYEYGILDIDEKQFLDTYFD